MKAVQFSTPGKMPAVVDIPVPEPGPGQVRLKVQAAGLCHSDVFLMETAKQDPPSYLPLTLGHEGVGIIDKLGEGVTRLTLGTPVAVYGPWGCGYCKNCSRGWENYCLNATTLGIAPPGLGSPGAMAEYMLVNDARHLAPIGNLDPVQAAPLTDAGLTPYHAIKAQYAKLGPGTTAVVVGVGGLGHVAIQILKGITAAKVIALDLSDEKLSLAREVGADATVLTTSKDPAAEVRALTGGLGADVAFDFAGVQATIDIATKCVAVAGAVTIVGISDGAYARVGLGHTPWEADVRMPYWGYRDELREVLDLGQEGKVHVETEVFAIDDAPKAYQKLWDGTLRGRAVIDMRL